jgi:hypothetical protein
MNNNRSLSHQHSSRRILLDDSACNFELETTFDDNMGSFANMFDIRTISGEISIFAIEIYIDVPKNVFFEIYTKTNSFRDDEGKNSLKPWKLVKKGFVTGAGRRRGTLIRDFTIGNITMAPNELRAFYVTLNTPDLRYRDLRPENPDAVIGDLFIDNEDLELYVGISLAGYPLQQDTPTFGKRAWSGKIHYLADRTCVPSASPSLPDTLFPTIQNSNEPSQYASLEPTIMETMEPTIMETIEPTISSTSTPTDIDATREPSVTKTLEPTLGKSSNPTVSNTLEPSIANSKDPTFFYSQTPTKIKTNKPITRKPTIKITPKPTHGKTLTPTNLKTPKPTNKKTMKPINPKTSKPSSNPTSSPSPPPSTLPSIMESMEPTGYPTEEPSSHPTLTFPSKSPTFIESETPSTLAPTSIPSLSVSLTPRYPEPEEWMCSEKKILATELDGSTGAYGNMFTVTTKEENIKVTTLSFHTDNMETDTTVIVYTKPGDFVGFENQPRSWRKIGESTLRGAGVGYPTKIPENDFQPVYIIRNNTVSFYITLTSADIRYSRKNSTLGDVAAFDDYLTIHTGVGVADYPFASEFFLYSPRTFNGIVHFSTEAECLPTMNITYSFTVSHSSNLPESDLAQLVATNVELSGRSLAGTVDDLLEYTRKYNVSVDSSWAEKSKGEYELMLQNSFRLFLNLYCRLL